MGGIIGRGFPVSRLASERLEKQMIFGRHFRNAGSGSVVLLGIIATAAAIILSVNVFGWDTTWHAFGVTPLQPPFYDMHVINDYAACVQKGVDAYAPKACSSANFNIPPAWLWIGSIGIKGSDSAWLSAVIITAAATIMVLLFKGRTWSHGAVALVALISPSVLMGVERANLDLLILALVGSAALIYDEKSMRRVCGAAALICSGIVLKIIPVFCVSLIIRRSRQTLLFAGIVTAFSVFYFYEILDYLLLVRRNVPSTFVLSYGFKSAFMGIDHLRGWAGLSPIRLEETWAPALTAAGVLIAAGALALHSSGRNGSFAISVSPAGTAFLFGAGIYCGTYVLGTNFIYRLMFLLLCIPQLQDWQTRWRNGAQSNGNPELGLYAIVVGVLWLNGNANGHSVSAFIVLPQVLNWILFFAMSYVLMAVFLRNWRVAAKDVRDQPER